LPPDPESHERARLTRKDSEAILLDQDGRTIDAALRAAERLYDEEETRFRQTEQKATALLAVAGVLLTVFSRVPSIGTKACLDPILRVLSIGTITALLAAFIFGLIALRPRTQFKRMKPADLASDATRTRPAEELKRELLERYCEAVTENSRVTEQKLGALKSGFISVLVALSLMSLAAILTVVEVTRQ
jgi:hypothetical protein